MSLVLLFVILFVCVGIIYSVVGTMLISGLQDYFRKKYPEEWDRFKRSKPRFFMRGRMQPPWSSNVGAIHQFVEASPTLLKDAVLLQKIGTYERFRITAAVAFSIIFVLLLLSR